LLRYHREGTLSAYALVGVPTREGDAKCVAVLEIASQEGEVSLLQPLLNAIADIAHKLGRPVELNLSDTAPALPVFSANGYKPRPRHFVLMGKVLDPAVTATKVWRDEPALRDINVVAWTPSGEWPLHLAGARSAARTLRLEMKDETLTRLLLARVHLSSAVAAEEIGMVDAKPGDLLAMEQALPFAPWCYHPLDYI